MEDNLNMSKEILDAQCELEEFEECGDLEEILDAAWKLEDATKKQRKFNHMSRFHRLEFKTKIKDEELDVVLALELKSGFWTCVHHEMVFWSKEGGGRWFYWVDS